MTVKGGGYVADKFVGKTVEKVVEGIDSVLIKFTDGTYTGIQARREWDELTTEFNEPVGFGLVDLGVMTHEEYQAAYTAQQEAQKAKSEKEREEKELRDYERLKAKFEGK